MLYGEINGNQRKLNHVVRLKKGSDGSVKV